MNAKTLLESQAAQAFKELEKSLEGVGQPLSWATLALKEGEYLNTDGAVLSVVQHIAGGKRMYGSIAFQDGAFRWRDCAELYEEVAYDWVKTLADLQQAHECWLDSWAGLTPDDLEQPYRHFRGEDWPAWRIITTVTQHDAYHAGQIELLKVSLQPSSQPPPSTAGDIRKYCRDLPNW